MGTNYIGKYIAIPSGAKVRKAGFTTTRDRTTYVTVRGQEPARNGKTRVFWKSHGVTASTLLS